MSAETAAPMGGIDAVAPMGDASTTQVSPELLNKPVRPDDNSADLSSLRQEKELIKQKNSELLGKNKKFQEDLKSLREELDNMRSAQQSAARESLESQGAYKELYEQEKARAKTLEQRLLSETSELKASLEHERSQVQREHLKAAALGEISRANALNPEQLYQLIAPELRVNEDNRPVLLRGGVEMELSDALSHLKQAAEWQHNFSPSGATGMSMSGSASVAPGMANPYRDGNLTEAMKLETSNPELAKALKAEAMRG